MWVDRGLQAVSAEVVKTTKAFREIEEKKQNAENRAKVLLEKQKTVSSRKALASRLSRATVFRALKTDSFSVEPNVI